MRIVQITADDRMQLKLHDSSGPCFGTAPAALIEGFGGIPDVELHVVSCSSVVMPAPEKLGENIWFHQPVVNKWGWGRSMFFGCVKSVRKLLLELKPDIVHGQGTERYCALAATFSGFPNLFTIHGNMRVHARRADNGNRPYYVMAAFLETLCLKKADGIVAISNYTHELTKNLVQKSWVVPNAVDSRFFEIVARPSRVPRVLFVGTLNQRKNPMGLIRACAEMLRRRECTLVLAGRVDDSSCYMRECQKLIGSLPGVEILGHIGRDELMKEFARASLLVLPTFEDNCPMVVLEAMAAGVPVAASRVGGVPDIVSHQETGLLFDPNDILEMEAGIRRLIHDEALREAMGRCGRQRAMERFSPRVVAERHLEIYAEILNGKR